MIHEDLNYKPILIEDIKARDVFLKEYPYSLKEMFDYQIIDKESLFMLFYLSNLNKTENIVNYKYFYLDFYNGMMVYHYRRYGKQIIGFWTQIKDNIHEIYF